MRYRGALCIFLAILLWSVNLACKPDPPPPEPPEPNGEDDAVIILRVQNDVFVKQKDSDRWLRVVKDWTFHSGDVLKVGDLSKALVDCRNPCELGTGDYTSCCIEACQVAANIQPPDGETHKFFLKKQDLPKEEARLFAEQESKIAGLGLESTATQFLRARLYTTWKLNEAASEVQTLGEQLDKPEAKEQLGPAYTGVLLKTGDLFVKVDQKDKAVERYNKTINLPPDSNAPADGSADKAAAHRRLAEIYVEKGKKVEAAEQLNRAKEIYVRRGDENKAKAIDKRIMKVQKP